MTTFVPQRADQVTPVDLDAPPVRERAARQESQDDVRRHELAAFLRSRRERISPDQVGLPFSGRRRTPGLRREEVAQLAGVGVTWYTWLEQGRDIRASEQVLGAIAATLQLDPYERAHLFTLAGAPEPPMQKQCKVITPAIQQMLRQLEPIPANVTNSRLDLLAYNRTYDEMVGGLDRIPFEERNTMLQAFTNAEWRSRIMDWEVAAPRIVAQFRAAMAQHVAESSWKCLVKRLREESPEFAALWQHHDVRPPENSAKRYRHPVVGILHLDFTHLWLGPRSEIKLTSYTAVDEDSRRRLEVLQERALDRLGDN
jgi:transcriptional regulator with XRE-family HTH domain